MRPGNAFCHPTNRQEWRPVDLGKRMDQRLGVHPVAAGDEPLPELEALAAHHTSPCGDGQMVLRSWGTGPALVLLHGGSGSWRHWARNIPVLMRTHRVIVPDQPGLGDSASPPDPYTPMTVGHIVAGGITAVLGAERYDLCGFSFGAMIASQVAAHHGARLRSLTICGAGAMGFPRHSVGLVKVRALEGQARIDAHRENLRRLMIADPAAIDPLALAIQEVSTRGTRMKSPQFASTTALLDAVATFPNRLNGIWGSADVTATPSIEARRERLMSVRPDIDFHIIEGAGHWVQYEAADAFNAILLDMLA
jgi:pimeloyl-ACP methyl ester carboxylesterase